MGNANVPTLGKTDFYAAFLALTGHAPMPWQSALYERFVGDGPDNIPASCNLPTGLGKTSVIVIWLIALATHPRRMPRRLVYVVNRRTVVDQTTNEVQRFFDRLQEPEKFPEHAAVLRLLKENLSKLCGNQYAVPLAISTLRGQFADNREWSADPSRPAVICGTVDMIGSRLLFSGYGVGFKAKPLHAGFLGQDVLLIHDEAHLEPAFQELIKAVQTEQGRCKEFEKFRVMELTATTRSSGDVFPNAEECRDNESHPEVRRRITAKKKLTLHQVGDGKDAVAEKIADLAKQHKDSNAAVLIFVRTLDEVKKVCDRLTSKKDGVSADNVQQLTGTMRGLERDRMAKCDPVFMRFLPEKNRNPKVEPAQGAVYLVCTSAGEVGIDISADHMVCDLSTFDSMAQRLGRVNRYGDGDARIDVVHLAKLDENDKLTPARQATLKLLGKLEGDVSPLKLGTLDGQERQAAFAPEPTILPATDILFDAWAMTSIRKRMPGRPDVAPYLHGIADDLPQTTIAWRAELDLLKDDLDPRAKLRVMFSKHRIRPHESLTVRSSHAIKFLKEITGPKVRPDLLDTRVALIFARNLELTTIKALIDDPGPLNADPTLVLPENFGGLDDKGMLNVTKSSSKKRNKADVSSDDAADEEMDAAAYESTLDIADVEGYERDKDAKPRLRILIEHSEDGWSARAMPGGKGLPIEWELEDAYEKSTRLINQIRQKSGLQVRLIQAVKFDDEGNSIRSLVCLSPPSKQGQLTKEQPLIDHVSAVENEANRLAGVLFQNDKIINAALRFAAKWHDEGKKADRWQRYIGGPDADGQLLGKSAEWRNPRSLAGYRHEFGSLLRILCDDEAKLFFADSKWELTVDEQEQALELVLHLIAAHHGYGRPHFACLLHDDFNAAMCEQTHLDVIRRFARLQRQYGRWGLAYLESLLRAADWTASREDGFDPESDDDDERDGADEDKQ